MIQEKKYTESTSKEHLKRYGQYFTPPDIAAFMINWVSSDAKTILDPALGNSIFFKQLKDSKNDKILTGFEIDKNIVDFFGNPTNTSLFIEDYLTSDWSNKYDGIVCNPPYSKFQAVEHRDKIIKDIYLNTGIKFGLNTNLYILFLIKSIYQLNPNGKLAFIIPTEFLNSEYGNVMKQFLIDKKLLNTIINLKNDDIFYNATTTSCIILLDFSEKEDVSFYNLESTSDLKKLDNNLLLKVSYDKLDFKDKWRKFLNQESNHSYKNLKDCSSFLKVSRGIATGANDFFCFSLKKTIEWEIPTNTLLRCICRSADIKKNVFSNEDFEELRKLNKNVYVLNATSSDEDCLKNYLSYGIDNNIHNKHLPSRRKPWFSMEKKIAAPIWISSASRKNIKVVRNIANVNNLTTFHSIHIHNTHY